ncbi:hypothetical protein NM208_g1412 [Fusarium decemcellulare]|uniref:Uncharacterized protein n=1 Tax=Fusarium decemcellulare TaxID=57161 RepID=A0ACC1SW55_9HYPO|nr:hypothetical protein NM208_g1412 [Fusarium decemcellulare]
MSFSRGSTATLGRDHAVQYPESQTNYDVVPDQIDPGLLHELNEGSPPKRLIIAVDFGTTYSAVSYVPIPEGCPPELVDPRSIRSIRNYPESWNFSPNDPMMVEVPTEVMYPLNRHFREEEDRHAADQNSSNGVEDTGYGRFLGSDFGTDAESIASSDTDGDLDMLASPDDQFRWGYQVHERRSLPMTHADSSNQPLSRFKLMLDNSPATEPLRRSQSITLDSLRARKIIKGPLHVIADFLTHLLKHTQSQLWDEGFDSSYRREIVLCVPAIWTQKSCRDMQACLAVAMERSNFEGVNLHNNSIENLFIVSEPEAAAAYVLAEKSGFQCGDIFVLLDAGGGTVDANTYEISNRAPLRLSREVVPPGGGLYGSSYLNEGFHSLLRKRLESETYLEQGSETINGIIEKIMIDLFEYRVKRSFEYHKDKDKDTAPKLFSVSGLRDNPRKGFKNGCIKISVGEITKIFMTCLKPIGSLMEAQITAAMQKDSRVTKVILIGGFAASPSLQKYLKHRLLEFNRQHNSRVTLVIPEYNIVNAVASGAVLRALNKEQGPSREARSSYGILRTEPFGEYPEHENLKPSYDAHDGQPYIMNTIDWVLKLGNIVPSKWQCPAFVCSHTFDVWPVRPLLCKEILYVSDRSTRSHYRLSHENNEGAEKVGEIVVDFSFLRQQGVLSPIEPVVNEYGRKVGTRHYRINYTMVIEVIDRDLQCIAIYNNKVRKRCRINIASGFRPGVK